VYVPLALVGGWVHAVAKFNPTTVLLEAGRGLISGGPVKVALAFAIALGLAALFALWSRGGLRSAESAA
jgi:ABC-type multidrug transport system permease subunit